MLSTGLSWQVKNQILPNVGFEEDIIEQFIKNVLSALKDRYCSTRLIRPFFFFPKKPECSVMHLGKIIENMYHIVMVRIIIIQFPDVCARS